MKIQEFVFALVIGVIVSWWFFLRSPNVSPQVVRAVQPKLGLDPVKLTEMKINTPPAASSAGSMEVKKNVKEKLVEPHAPPLGHVAFEVREGVAITQGDIVLGKVLDDNKVDQGIAKATRPRLWESAVIPFSIQEGVTNREAIFAAIDQFHKETNIRFVPYSEQKDSLVFVKSDELCASYLGRVGGAQPIFLSPKCGAYEVRHELMHALGFVHEHSRPDRDKYLEVVWTNIEQKYWPQFWIIPDELIHDYVGSVFSFDPQSMMLYDPTAFAQQAGTVSLRSKTSQDLQPTRTGFSPTDRERLFYLYGR